MGIFKTDGESKRVIFNINGDIADRLEAAKLVSRRLGKRLDVDTPVNKSLEKFLKKAEKKLAELLEQAGGEAPQTPGMSDAKETPADSSAGAESC